MAIRQTYEFNTGPNGAAIATGGDILAVSGATYTNDAKHGAFAARFANGTQYVRIANSGTTNHSGSLYVKITADPNSSSARVVTLSSSTGTVLMAIRAHSDNKFDIADSGGVRKVASSVSWVVGQWYRLDWQWDQTTLAKPKLTVRIFTTPEGTVPNDTLTWTAASITANQYRWLLGVAATTAFSGTIDTFRISNGLEWIGPFAPTVPVAGSIIHLWAGAPTENGFRVVAKTSGATSTRMKVCTDVAMTQDALFTTPVVPDSAGYASHTIAGLAANTQYYYQIEDTPTGGTATLIGEVGKAHTLPQPGVAQNFTFAFGSCVTNNNPDGRSFTSIMAWNPLFFIHLGDFHYRDPTSTDPAFHAQLWANQIAGTAQLKPFVRDVPMFYIRSDHDSAPGDNADSNNASTQASIDAYKQVVPAPALADTRLPTVGLYFSWVVGRIRFIAVDVRNKDRSPGLDPQSPSKTMLGATQKQWLKDQLLMSEPVKVIVTDVPWSGPASTTNGEDKWWSYDDERTEIGNFIVANGVQCVMLSGDAHSLCCDDGSHNAWGGFSIYGSSPMANVGGGRNLNYYTQVYNTGTSDARQWGRVTVTDDGSTIALHFEGYDAINDVIRVNQTDTFAAATPLMAATATGTGQIWSDSAGTWVKFTPKVQENGAIKSAKAKVYKDGRWITAK